MWDIIKKDPWARIIILIISVLLLLSLVFMMFNLLFVGQGNMLNYHYSMMPGYYVNSPSILGVFAKLLLFVSSISFIISLAVSFVKTFSNLQGSKQADFQSAVPNHKSCDQCGFVIENDWKCCPKCGLDIEKQEVAIENHSSDETNEAEAENEKQQDEQIVIKTELRDDIVERLYQTDTDKNKKNKKGKKKSEN